MSTITSIEPEPVQTDRWVESGERRGRVVVPMMALVLFGAPLGTVSAPLITPFVAVEIGSATPSPSPVSPETASRVRRLKTASDLTWEQLARLMGVSRRTLHSWDVGAPMTAAHRERLDLMETRVDSLINSGGTLFDRHQAGTSYFHRWSKEAIQASRVHLSPADRVSSTFENVESGLGATVSSTEFDWDEV